jgi:transposase
MAAGGAAMADLFWLMKAQIQRIALYFPLSHGVPRLDDQRVVSGILHVIRNGLRWRDAPAEYGPHKTLYNRFVRWSRRGSSTASSRGWQDARASLLKKGLFPTVSAAPRRASCRSGAQRPRVTTRLSGKRPRRNDCDHAADCSPTCRQYALQKVPDLPVRPAPTRFNAGLIAEASKGVS